MHDFMAFLSEHLLLVAAFVVVLALLIMEEARAEKTGGKRLTPQAAVSLINGESAAVVDVRNDDAYAGGHIVKAIRVPVSSLNGEVKKLNKYKDKPVIVVCQKGQQSRVAVKKLTQQGFSKVYVLAGGVAAWKEAGFPLSKKK